MVVATATPTMTTEELLAMPDDGVERWLIRGELRGRPTEPGERSMTVRNRFHSRVMIRVGKFLDNWLDQQPEPRGQVLGGEVGVMLARDPDSTVGVAVVYVPPEVTVRQTDETSLVDGVPTFAVEILSPNDTVEDIKEKIDTYLAANVPLVWIINPYHKTVTVHSPGAEPVLFNVRHDLAGDPHLPGFHVPVARLFE